MMGTSLAIQWLRLCDPTAGGTQGLVHGWGKIPHAMHCGQKKKKDIKKNNGFISSYSSYLIPNEILTLVRNQTTFKVQRFDNLEDI